MQISEIFGSNLLMGWGEGGNDVSERLTTVGEPPVRDDRIPGNDQAVRGGRHGQKLHSGFPPGRADAPGSADARSGTDACLS